jgi:hypothetical protein
LRNKRFPSCGLFDSGDRQGKIGAGESTHLGKRLAQLENHRDIIADDGRGSGRERHALRTTDIFKRAA